MNRRVAGAPLGAVVVALCAGLLPACGGGSDSTGTGAGGGDEVDLSASGDSAGPLVDLYFPNERGTLSAEGRSLPPWSSPEEGARILIEALLAGPESESLGPPLPEGTTLGSVHLSDLALLYVDLVSTVHPRPPVSGSRMELTSVYSVVDSVLLNLPDVEAIVLLWNGRQLPTFAGHVDTSLPLRADADLVSR